VIGDLSTRRPPSADIKHKIGAGGAKK